MLSKIRQSQKDKYCIIPLIWEYLRVVEYIETESRMVVASGREHGYLLFNGYRISVLQDEGFWKLVVQYYEYT